MAGDKNYTGLMWIEMVNQLKTKAAPKLDIQKDNVRAMYGEQTFGLVYFGGLPFNFYYRMLREHMAQVYAGKGFVIDYHRFNRHRPIIGF
jgi:hypothetical protein